jgi:hypothetical protein
MSGLLKVLAAITPAQQGPAPVEYDGYQLGWKMLVFRPAYFKFEAAALLVLGAYMMLYLLGKTFNQGRINSL